MNTFIEKLQKKPIHVRQQILVTTSFGITGFIIVIWFATLGLRTHGTSASLKENLKPFAIIKDNIVQVYADASKGLQSAQAPNK